MTSDCPPRWVAIVSGLPRSGTSMMMQMLAAGGLPVLVDHQRAADEDNLRGYLEFEPVKRTCQDASWLRDAPGKVVKMVYLLLYDLPADYHYRVVMMQRPLDEVLASQRAMLARRGESGAGLSPAQMSDVLSRQLEKIDQWLADQSNFRALKVDYHDVLACPAEQAARISDFLERDLDQMAMAAAVDPTLRRQKG